jgi:hypothetical protein
MSMGAQLSLRKHPEPPNAPLISDYARADEAARGIWAGRRGGAVPVIDVRKRAC